MSFWELLVIIMVAFVVIKPERLPEMAYLLGKCIWRIRTAYHNIIRKFSLYS